jgi:hypothetical protein
MDTDREVDLGALGIDGGGHLLIDRALADMTVGQRLRVTSTSPYLAVHLGAWARSRGHGMADGDTIVRGDAADRRLTGAVRAGQASTVESRAPSSWGLAPRGSLVELGGPALALGDLDSRDVVWTELAPKLYAKAASAQWDPQAAIDWTPPELPDDVERAVVQLMTYLVENEQAAMLVPARFLARMHPHFREAMQFLATQIADEARHVEVFTRRAELSGQPLGVSGGGGRASLQTLLDEPDWETASFLLSALGEGTFLSLLAFLHRWAPDPLTAQISQLVVQDEARHVAFALGHLREHAASDPRLRDRLRAAVERRHDALAQTAGLAPHVHDALVIIAAGCWEPAALAAGWVRVQELEAEMDEGRRRRLMSLGFSDHEAAELSALHSRNFM